MTTYIFLLFNHGDFCRFDSIRFVIIYLLKIIIYRNNFLKHFSLFYSFSPGIIFFRSRLISSLKFSRARSSKASRNVFVR